ncbi:hypothetical protein KKG36_01685 [Patescibacteria group bacterium]|nr:hypothetical protein [Patescibacteria group bacterium]
MVFNKTDGPRAPKPKIKGDWKCSECACSITELPFEPAPDRPIYCTDCWAKKRPPKFSR